jgi:dTDP-4-amino-4,6-dideoxygalactose transaminase
MNIHFIDLNAQYQRLKKPLDGAMESIITESAFVKGKAVRNFEAEFGEFLEASHVVSCGNGTDALEMILDAFEIGKGDEVLVPSVSWISTAEVVATRGAKPVFVDIDLNSFCLNPDLLSEKLTSKTKAIIPVHLYGHPAAMEPILDFAKAHGLYVIEDSAQAHGATIDGKMIGSFGDAAAFSFFPTKNLGAFGDAGCMLFKEEKHAEIARQIANHGQAERHRHIRNGRNSRLDGLQAAVLSVKLNDLPHQLQLRRKVADSYKKLLADCAEIVLPKTSENKAHAYHLFVIRTKKRNALKEFLSEQRIPTMVHYPTALPFQPVYGHKKEEFPEAFRQQEESLSLPMYPELPEEHIHYICKTLKLFFSEKA